MFISGYKVSAFPRPAGGLSQVYTESETVCVSTCGCSYVERVEAPADRRHHIGLPVLQVVPERVRHVVGIKSQDPETGEQRAAAGRHVRSAHLREHRIDRETQVNSRHREEPQRKHTRRSHEESSPAGNTSRRLSKVPLRLSAATCWTETGQNRERRGFFFFFSQV